MRLSLLQMAFGKHIERKNCCFFAGSILDEVLNVLQHIRVTKVLGRPYKVTDELFDQSTMAMEYFKEHIEPGLPDLVYFSKSFLNFTCASDHYLVNQWPPKLTVPSRFSQLEPELYGHLINVDPGKLAHLLTGTAVTAAYGVAEGNPEDQAGHEAVQQPVDGFA